LKTANDDIKVDDGKANSEHFNCFWAESEARKKIKYFHIHGIKKGLLRFHRWASRPKAKSFFYKETLKNLQISQ